MKDKWKWLVPAAAYVLAFASNIGCFWWTWDIGVLQVITSMLYIGMGVWFFWSGGASKKRLQTAVWIGGLTIAAGIVALFVRWGMTWLTIPALLLAGVAVTPLYGVSGLISDFDWGYGMVILVGTVWLFGSLWLVKRRK